MTDWIDLPPRMQHMREAIVTIALAQPKVGSAVVRINASRSIGDALGWHAKMKVAIARSPDGRRIRVSDALADQGYTIGLRGTTFTINFRLPWLTDSRDSYAAERTTHCVAAGGLIIDLPRWARLPTSLAEPITAADAIAEARREALDLLAGGKSVIEVAGIVGEDAETVRAWRAAA